MSDLQQRADAACRNPGEGALAFAAMEADTLRKNRPAFMGQLDERDIRDNWPAVAFGFHAARGAREGWYGIMRACREHAKNSGIAADKIDKASVQTFTIFRNRLAIGMDLALRDCDLSMLRGAAKFIDHLGITCGPNTMFDFARFANGTLPDDIGRNFYIPRGDHGDEVFDDDN